MCSLPGLECLYILVAAPGRIITLEVEDLDLEKDRDYILVRDGDNPSSQPIARYLPTYLKRHSLKKRFRLVYVRLR